MSEKWALCWVAIGKVDKRLANSQRARFFQPKEDAPENPVRKRINYWAEHSKTQDVLEYRVEILKRAVEEFRKLLSDLLPVDK